MAYSKYHQARIDAGLCKDCGNARGRDGTSVFCRPCANVHSRKQSQRKVVLREKWKQAGPLVCNQCGGGLPDDLRKVCAKCIARSGSSRRARAPHLKARKEMLGECARCNRPRFHLARHCRKHILEDHLRKSGIPMSRHEEFWRKLEDQDFRCYYTGRALVPGVNMSLDHRTPTSRGGSKTDIDNCVWCDRDINSFKGSLTEDEFIQLCGEIFNRFR